MRRAHSQELVPWTSAPAVDAKLKLATLAARAAEADVVAGRGDLRAELSRIAAGLADAVAELQEVSRGIHPAILSERGLGPALRTLARRSGIRKWDISAADVEVEVGAGIPASVKQRTVGG